MSPLPGDAAVPDWELFCTCMGHSLHPTSPGARRLLMLLPDPADVDWPAVQPAEVSRDTQQHNHGDADAIAEGLGSASACFALVQHAIATSQVRSQVPPRRLAYGESKSLLTLAVPFMR